MNCLLDTQVLIWYITGDQRLGDDTVAVITNADNTLYFSMASYWEMCIKISIGKLLLVEHWDRAIDREMIRNGIRWLPIRRRHLQGVIDLPFHNRDPFDRLLVSQAVEEKLTIVTTDDTIKQYDVPVL